MAFESCLLRGRLPIFPVKFARGAVLRNSRQEPFRASMMDARQNRTAAVRDGSCRTRRVPTIPIPTS
jgi:hypothetical protein